VDQVWVEDILWHSAPRSSARVMFWMMKRWQCGRRVTVFSLNSDQTFGSGLSLSKEDLHADFTIGGRTQRNFSPEKSEMEW